MAKHLMVISVEENPEFTLEEICRVCEVSPDFVYEMIEYGAIDPRGFSKETLLFDENHLRRIRTINHLYHDLEVNMAGAALVVDMMEEMERMRAQIELFEKYLSRK